MFMTGARKHAPYPIEDENMTRIHLILGFAGCMLLSAGHIAAGELSIGTASSDITPDKPAALDGHWGLRISQKPDTPITANVIALESQSDGQSPDAAIMVSCDIVVINDILLDKTRQAVKKRLPEFDAMKVFINATHAHTAPVTRPGVYNIPKAGVMQPEEYCAFAGERIAEAIEKAWKSRKPGSFSWGLGHAAVAENRRATYADGHSEMYGDTKGADFRGLEGYEDHDVGTMFFWNKDGKLITIAVNVSCPSQEVEGNTAINADFWLPVRQSLQKHFGADVCVLGWTGASGDQSPHLMYRIEAEERMRNLRKLTRLEELSRRIAAAVEETYEIVKDDRHTGPMIHKVEMVELPMRLVTDSEYRETLAAIKAERPTEMRKSWYEETLRRYEVQKVDPKPASKMELHVLRIGDAAVCTNSFELYTDYGVQMKARSRAGQTFVIQLVGGGPFCYLPTERGVRGGSYSATVHSNTIGPEGGQVLVEETVKTINRIFK
jgi:hypothetical protein